MRALRWIFFLVVAAVVIAGAIAYTLPREITVTRSAEIAAPPAIVFPLVSDLRQMQSWSPWAELDPEMTVTYSGPSEGVGQTMSWSSGKPEVGSGEMKVTNIEPESRVDAALDFGPMGTATSWVDVAPAGDGSTVSWGFRTDLGMNPIARWYGLKIDDQVAQDYDRGLAKLKQLAEAEQAAAEEAARQAAEEAARKAAEEAARAAEEAARAARAAEEAARQQQAAPPEAAAPAADGTAPATSAEPVPATPAEPAAPANPQ